MIDGVHFSDRGDDPTDFEARLLAQASSAGAIAALGQRLMRDLGATEGARALAVVLDELGGSELYLPQRQSFFRELWRVERDALVLSLSTRPDWTTQDIAAALGMSAALVRHVRRQCSRVDSRVARAKRAAR